MSSFNEAAAIAAAESPAWRLTIRASLTSGFNEAAAIAAAESCHHRRRQSCQLSRASMRPRRLLPRKHAAMAIDPHRVRNCFNEAAAIMPRKH